MGDKPKIDARRAALLAAMEAHGIDPTNLSRRINRSKEFVRDYLEYRKKSMSVEDWDAIERELGMSLNAQGVAPDDVLAAIEVLLTQICESELVARHAAEALLKVLQDRQSLPAGVSRDAAIRLATHQTAIELSPKSRSSKH